MFTVGRYIKKTITGCKHIGTIYGDSKNIKIVTQETTHGSLLLGALGWADLPYSDVTTFYQCKHKCNLCCRNVTYRSKIYDRANTSWYLHSKSLLPLATRISYGVVTITQFFMCLIFWIILFSLGGVILLSPITIILLFVYVLYSSKNNQIK